MKRIVTLVLLLCGLITEAQHVGCTDFFAINFDAKATEGDNTCRYWKAVASPSFISELPYEVHETSGLIRIGDLLWTHNDSGGEPVLYALDTSAFRVVRRVRIANATNRDWEDIAADGAFVYVGDFGNNKGDCRDLKIYFFPIDKLRDSTVDEVVADTIRFTFSDQTDFTPRKQNHGFDCEAMFASDDNLYLLSKRWNDGKTTFYRLPKQAGTYEAEKIGAFFCDGLVTGADYDRENHRLVLIGYRNKVWEPFMYVIYSFGSDSSEWHGRRIAMPNHTSIQTEGITFADADHVFISAESSPAFSSRIFIEDISRWAGSAAGSCYDSAEHKDFCNRVSSDEIKLKRLKIRRGLYRFEIVGSHGNVEESHLLYVGKRSPLRVALPRLEEDDYSIYLFGRRKSYVCHL